MRPLLGSTMLLAALTSTACRTMKPVSLEQLNVLKPDRVWVTDADRPVVVVSGPHVVGTRWWGSSMGTTSSCRTPG